MTDEIESENETETKTNWHDDKTTLTLPIELLTSKAKGKGIAHYKKVKREPPYSVIERMIKFIELHGGKNALDKET